MRLDNRLLRNVAAVTATLSLAGAGAAAETAALDLFRGSIPTNMEASVWKTFKVSVDHDMRMDPEPGSIKITSEVEFAGCNYGFQGGKSLDLTPYWQNGALSFYINRTGSMSLGSVRLLDYKVPVDNVANLANMIPPLDADLASWQHVLIPLKSFSEQPLTAFRGIRFRVGRNPQGAAYIAKLQILPTYDQKRFQEANRRRRTGVNAYFPAKMKYAPEKIEAQRLLTAPPGRRTRITSLPVADCRLVRGFFGRAVDGRIDSFGWEGNGPRALRKRRPVREWPNIFSGVDYAFNGGDGMHVTLHSPDGFDLLTVQGGYAGTVRVEADNYCPPWGGRELGSLEGDVAFRNLHFPERVKANRISFVGRQSGELANIALYRVEVGDPRPADAGRSYLTSQEQEPSEEFAWYVTRLFENDKLQVLSDAPPEGWIDAAGRYLHFTIPGESDTPGGDYFLDAVEVKLSVVDTQGPATLHIRVADPFNPRLELAAVDVALAGAGDYCFEMDVVDQVVPAGKPVWVTLALDRGRILTGKDKSFLNLVAGNGQKTLAEYLNYRKFLFKSYFAIMIEQRPWWWNREAILDRSKVVKMDSGGDCIWEMVEMIRELKRLAPDDQVVDIYYRQIFGGGDTPLPEVEVSGRGPEWARLIRANFGQLMSIATWWMDHRQTPNGEFGGAVNDDTCLLMQFQNYPLCDGGVDGQRLRKAYALLAEHAEKTTMRKGLPTHRQDPLHAYEDGVNLYSAMPWLFYGDPVYIERCMESVASLKDITRLTPDGKRYFFQPYRKVGLYKEGESRDWNYQDDSFFMMVNAALAVAWYNQHPQALAFLREVFDSYLSHLTADKWPNRIYPEDGTVTYRTNRPLSFKADSAFVYMYYVTGDEAYLKPFLYGFAKDNWAWASHRSLLDILLRYDLEAKYPVPEKVRAGRPYVNFVLTGDKKPVMEGLKRSIAHFDYHDYLYKEAELFVDRLFVNNSVIKPFLGAMTQRNTLNCAMGAEWRGLDRRDYAAFVLINRPDRFKALVYNFTDHMLKGTVHPWQLKHGLYTCTVGIDSNEDDASDQTLVAEEIDLYRHKGYPLALQPGNVTVVDLTLKHEKDDVAKRADLAICERELSWDPDTNTLAVPVHNIGCLETGGFVIRVSDLGGKTVAEKTFPSIAAPLDLQAKVLKAQIRLPGDLDGFRIGVDPDNRVSEITEENNSVTVTGGPAGFRRGSDAAGAETK